MTTLTVGQITPDMPDHEYHSHASLSSTGAKRIIECPAEFDWYRRNPEQKDVFDFGTVVHTLVLGKGAGVTIVDHDSWRSKAAQEAKAQARKDGLVPLLAHEFECAEVVANTVLHHPIIGPWFEQGQAELSAATIDPTTGVQMRARFDWLTELDGRPTILDVKTAGRSVHPWSFGKTIADFKYHLSAAFYRRVAIACGIEDPDFRLVAVSKEAPHEVRAFTLPQDALDVGDELTDRALDLYRQCTEHDQWPCLHPAVVEAELPRYAYL